MSKFRTSLLGAAAIAAAAFSPAAFSPAQAASLFETVSTNPQLGLFTSMIRKAGLEQELRTRAGITVFAPTNAAIEALPFATYRRLTETGTPAEVQAVVRSHMVTWNTAIPLGTDGTATMVTLAGTQLGFQGTSSSTVRVNGRLVQQVNLRADNGFVHIVSDVLPTP
ncbi:fasciclin domain-containing protein [Falsiroseomonas sp. E2-1-a20]|uniref:fasciclin domain-containing protein n=1 Tax=Falsiroseomonas sp. E2-1-a20 TaxID=3239300 RepID=UPI003F35B7DE